MISHSLGAMPQRARARLAQFADELVNFLAEQAAKYHDERTAERPGRAPARCRLREFTGARPFLQAKLERLRARGNAFPNDFRRDALAGELLAGYAEATAEALEASPVRGGRARRHYRLTAAGSRARHAPARPKSTRPARSSAATCAFPPPNAAIVHRDRCRPDR